MALGDREPTSEEELEQFLPRLKDELSRIKSSQSYQRNTEALLHWGIRQVSPNLADRDIRVALEVGGAGEHGIDAAWWDAEATHDGQKEGTYFLAQSKCPDFLVDVDSFGAEPAQQLASGFDWISEVSDSKLKPSLKRVHSDLREHLAAGQRVVLAVVIGGRATEGLHEEIKVVNRKLAAGGMSPQVSMELYDLHRLDCLYQDRLEQGDLAPPPETRFRIRTDKHLRAYGTRRALIAQVPVLEIYKMVEATGPALFAKNLRVGLSHSPYNEGISHTLSTEGERENFWYYNNGITAVCKDFDFDPNEDVDDRFESVIAHELSVVNGCQTCDTIHNSLSDWKAEDRAVPGLANVDVLVRLIEVGEGGQDSAAFGRDIARYTNSQNPIKPRNLRANDPEQMRFREQLRGRGYFFETKPGEWERRNEKDPGYRHLFPRLRPVIDNEKAGQYFLSFWLDKAVAAKMDKKGIFGDDATYRSIFGMDTKAEAMLLSWLLSEYQDHWRKDAGYLKRAPNGKRRNRISRGMVYTHGNLILLGMVGSGLKLNLKGDLVSDAPRLGHACDVLTQILEGARVGAINVKATTSALDRAFKHCMEVLYEFVETKLGEDPDVNVRNVTVKDSVLKDIMAVSATEVAAATKDLKTMLLG